MEQLQETKKSVDDTSSPPSSLSSNTLNHHHFVLIHGASHGAWCWYKLRCLLESCDHKVSCIDLASAGIDPTPADSISTFNEYNKPLLDFMSTLAEGEKVVVVGHSAGGLSLTQIIYNYPEKIKVVVFLAATMLKFGFMTEQDRKDGMPDLSKYGQVSVFVYGQGKDHPPTSTTLKKEFARLLLYNMSPLEDCALAAMSMKPCPLRPFDDAKFKDEGTERDTVPRVYIKTLHDRTQTPERQDLMISKWPPSEVYTIDSDHSPFFSNPSSLFGLLLKIASTTFTTI